MRWVRSSAQRQGQTAAQIVVDHALSRRSTLISSIRQVGIGADPTEAGQFRCGVIRAGVPRRRVLAELPRSQEE
jgi:hypothetical protein